MQFSEPKQLTDLGGNYLQAVYSPDGQRIAFAFSTNQDADMYLMNHDGTRLSRLTNGAKEEAECAYTSPHFNHDGTQIVCVREDVHDEELHEIYLIDARSTAGRILAKGQPALFPNFSPDGNCIVYNGIADDFPDIFRINVDGSEKTRLTYTTFDRAVWKGRSPHSYAPCYSPDGQVVAFKSSVHNDPNNRGFEIYRMRPDGSEQTRLTHSNGVRDEYIWHPDSKHIAYFCKSIDAETDERTGYTYLVNVESFDSRVLLTDSRTHHSMSFSPDGRYLAFDAAYKISPPDTKVTRDIFLLDTEIGDVQQLTDDGARNVQPVFRPDGKALLFTSNRSGSYELYQLDVLT